MRLARFGRLLAAIACISALLAAAPAGATVVQIDPAQNIVTAGGLTGVAQSGTLTRASNTTTYTANTAVCLFASTTICAPIPVTIAGANAATGTMGRVLLAKSSGVLTNANFTIDFYSAAPTLTGIYDNTADVGPIAADLPYYLGSYTCNAFQITNDGSAQSFSECTPTAPQGWMQYKTVTGQKYVYAVIRVTAAYVPTSAGTFTIYANSYRDQ